MASTVQSAPLLAREGALVTAVAQRRFALIVWLTSLAWFAAVGLRTPLDEDEGFYALAADLVAHGRIPYRDFFYPQMPLGSIFLAPFAALSPSFSFLRFVTCAMSALVAVLVAHAVERETRSRMAAVVAVLFFVTHELTWRWVPTLRPYALGEACALGALLLATPIGRAPTRRALLCAGALAALAPLARLPMAPTVGVVALALLLQGRSSVVARGTCIVAVVVFGASIAKHPLFAVSAAAVVAGVIAVSGRGGLTALRRAAWFALGLAAAVLVVVGPFALVAKQGLVFGAIDYHAETSKIVAWPHSRPLLLATLGGGSINDLSAMGTQNVLLVVANLAALTLRRAHLRFACLAGVAAIAVASARHQPAVEHYVTPLVPYLAIGAGIAFGGFERLARGRLRRVRFTVFGGALALFALATAGSFMRTWHEGMCGPWDFKISRPRATDQGLAAIAQEARANPGTILSYWPGSALGHATRMAPGFENQFARDRAAARSPEAAAALHLASEQQLLALVDARSPSVVVVDRGTGFGPVAEALESRLAAARYAKRRVVGAGGAFRIYVREP
jgi:hypothetical protein